MKTLVSKKALTRALALVHKLYTGAKPRTDRLVRLRTNDPNLLIVEASNGDVYLTLPVLLDRIIQPGEACVDVSELLHFLKPTIAKYIELSTTDDKLVLRADRLMQKLVIKPTEFFPEFPQEPQKYKEAIPSTLLSQGIKYAGFAVSKTKPGPLAHFYIDGRGGHTRFVSSDGHRLVVLKSDYASYLNIKLHFKSLNILKQLLNTNETIQIGFSESEDNKFVWLTNGAWKLAVRDFEGRYPLYEDLIWPDDAYDLTVEVLSDDLKNALSNFVKFDRISIEFTDHFLKISAQGIEAYVRADVAGNIGFSLDFDPQQLYEFVDSVPVGYGAFIKAKFANDDNVPAMFKLHDDYIYLVMPLIRKKSY